MKTFRAKVRAGGVVAETTIQAKNLTHAKKLLEAQYGRSNVFSVLLER